jgi:hypothetical protein
MSYSPLELAEKVFPRSKIPKFANFRAGRVAGYVEKRPPSPELQFRISIVRITIAARLGNQAAAKFLIGGRRKSASGIPLP